MSEFIMAVILGLMLITLVIFLIWMSLMGVFFIREIWRDLKWQSRK